MIVGRHVHKHRAGVLTFGSSVGEADRQQFRLLASRSTL
jgi:hypothetical protein